MSRFTQCDATSVCHVQVTHCDYTELTSVKYEGVEAGDLLLSTGPVSVMSSVTSTIQGEKVSTFSCELLDLSRCRYDKLRFRA